MVLNRILKLDANYNEAWRPMSLSYLFAGEYELAEAIARKHYNGSEGRGDSAANLIFCLATSGENEEAQQLYKKVKDTIPDFQFPASLHAKVNMYLGKTDEAFVYLNKALNERNTFLFPLKYSPEWDLLRPIRDLKKCWKE